MGFTRHSPTERRRGLTLMEFILALTIMAVLAGLGVAIIPGILEGQRKTRARAELAMIQSALEAYKTEYGQYPIVPDGFAGLADSSQFLFNACNRLIDPDEKIAQGRPWLNLSALTLENANHPDFTATTPALVANRIIDPWGNPYLYAFKADDDPAWTNYNYVLYSEGPDGASTPVGPDGQPNPAAANNGDNLYAP